VGERVCADTATDVKVGERRGRANDICLWQRWVHC
jgi:hypothetical protein